MICHEWPGVPIATVAQRACTVGTTQLTSPTSVEPIIGAPFVPYGTIKSHSGLSFCTGIAIRAYDDAMSSAESVAWISAAYFRSAASNGGGPSRSSWLCIAFSSGVLPNKFDTAVAIFTSTFVSVISAAPSATFRTRPTSAFIPSTSRARME